MLLDWAWPTDEAAIKLRPFILERRAGKGRKWAAQMWVRQWCCLCISRLNFTSDTGREEPSLPCSAYYPDWRCWSACGRVSDQKLCLCQTVSILHFIPLCISLDCPQSLFYFVPQPSRIGYISPWLTLLITILPPWTCVGSVASCILHEGSFGSLSFDTHVQMCRLHSW